MEVAERRAAQGIARVAAMTELVASDFECSPLRQHRNVPCPLCLGHVSIVATEERFKAPAQKPHDADPREQAHESPEAKPSRDEGRKCLRSDGGVPALVIPVDENEPGDIARMGGL